MTLVLLLLLMMIRLPLLAFGFVCCHSVLFSPGNLQLHHITTTTISILVMTTVPSGCSEEPAGT
jgi:hypothetical protein